MAPDDGLVPLRATFCWACGDQTGMHEANQVRSACKPAQIIAEQAIEGLCSSICSPLPGITAAWEGLRLPAQSRCVMLHMDAALPMMTFKTLFCCWQLCLMLMLFQVVTVRSSVCLGWQQTQSPAVPQACTEHPGSDPKKMLQSKAPDHPFWPLMTCQMQPEACHAPFSVQAGSAPHQTLCSDALAWTVAVTRGCHAVKICMYAMRLGSHLHGQHPLGGVHAIDAATPLGLEPRRHEGCTQVSGLLSGLRIAEPLVCRCSAVCRRAEAKGGPVRIQLGAAEERVVQGRYFSQRLEIFTLGHHDAAICWA